MNPGPPPGVPATTPRTPPHAVEPADLASVGGQQKRTDGEEEDGSAAELSRGRSAVEYQSTGHPSAVAGERGGSPGRSMGGTFLTAVQQPDVDKNRQRGLVSRRERDNTGGHGAPDDRPARVTTQLAVAEDDSSIATDSAAQTLHAVGSRGNKHARLGDDSAWPNRAGSEAATEGEKCRVGVEGGVRKGLGRLWDGDRAPSDSFDKQRVTPTSAR